MDTGAGGSPRPAIGLALAGGGPQGAIWEIGALRAVEEFVDGIDLNDLHVYVGVSAGSFLVALLANGLTPAQLCRAVLRREDGVHPFSPGTFFRPAAREWLRGGLRVPGLLAEGVMEWFREPRRASLVGSLGKLTRSLPVAVFDNEPIREYLAEALSRPGRSDDFRRLGKRLLIVAADLETGRAVRFGKAGFDHVPISVAVQASTALPGLYPPVEIDGRSYVDGVLLKTVHASVAFDDGAAFLLCINPLVPVDTERAARNGAPVGGSLRDLGLPAVLEQTFRTMIHSRLVVGMAAYGDRYPDRDVLLVEPDAGDPDLFFRNTFSFRERGRICLSGWSATRAFLGRERERIGPILERHGARLCERALDDPNVRFWDGIGIDPEAGRGSSARRLDALLDRLERQKGDWHLFRVP